MAMTTLLLSHAHNYSEALRRPQPRLAPGYVKRAEAYIEAHAGEPLSVAVLAAHVGASASSLHDGFQRFRNTTPMAHLRSVRLQRINAELRAAEPGRTAVTDVAMRWGFVHLGHFAAAYKKRFGESPSETLRHRH
jgi:AraC-like DNA-binding protein